MIIKKKIFIDPRSKEITHLNKATVGKMIMVLNLTTTEDANYKTAYEFKDHRKYSIR